MRRNVKTETGWSIRFYCEAEGCKTDIKLHKKEDPHNMVMLPHIVNHAQAVAKDKGWLLGVAVPNHVRAVKKRDDLGNPVEWHMIPSVFYGDLCPACGSIFHPERYNHD